MIRSKWAQDHHDKVKNDPEYLAARLMIEINDKFCARMEELGLSQRELARRIGRSQPFIWKLLNHGTNMTLKTLVLMAQAMELTVEPPRLIPKESSICFSTTVIFPKKIQIYQGDYIKDINWEKDPEGAKDVYVSNVA